jgi:hypothetical protein
MSNKTCKVCEHPRLKEITANLLRRVPYLEIGRRHSGSPGEPQEK